MTADLPAIKRDLAAFDFTSLFIEQLGWDHLRSRLPIQVGDEAFMLHGIAEKSGFAVFRCEPGPDGRIPPSDVRTRIDSQLAKLHLEHLLVFTDRDRTEQLWLFVRRLPGQPLKHRQTRYRSGDHGDLLAQRLRQLQVSLQEDIAGIDIGLIAGRVRGAMDVEKVTKKFYERYKKEHEVFRDAIGGIPEGEDRDWYASVMLNRLMFVYFIQKKGFLDNDPDYLRNRQDTTLAERGAGQFLTFYRHFLRRLFHDGLGAPESERDAALRTLIGDVPYLNGGLFDEHQLEEAHRGIDIPDAAFTRLFDFFDAYQWRLDESGRHGRADNEIDPDVLGYIFEKYINQKQMGAYYTKEDVTGYISQNTIIPAVFDKAMPRCQIAFAPDGDLWRLLRESPDDYIYPAVRHGMDLDLPAEIEAGVHDVSRRTGWNAAAPADYALPTETWRELVARRQRCADLRERLESGEVTRIDDLVTLNLDIRQFAEDAISSSASPDLVRAFWKALTEVTVLDPTCGSGAFLFAALNVLEPLYEACLDRMQGFLDDLERDGDRHSPAKFSDFRKELEDIARHPNREYFIYKRIILDNLYGVDIMEEAVEICKLRLFLKLVSQVDDARRIEPLPDIDFNVRAGNTVVGFASYQQAKLAATGNKGIGSNLVLDLDGDIAKLDERAEIAARSYSMFKTMQTGFEVPSAELRLAKATLEQQLEDLRDELDTALAMEYRVSIKSPGADQVFAEWKSTHEPFHWFIEFYDIMQNGGFSCVIGNPPYIEVQEVKKRYSLLNYRTWDCGNLFAPMYERAVEIAAPNGRVGMIIPVASMCTEGYGPLQGLLINAGSLWVTSYSDRPGRLFDGLEHIRLSIVLWKKDARERLVHASGYMKWNTEARSSLFPSIEYCDVTADLRFGRIAKVQKPIEIKLLQHLQSLELALDDFLSPDGKYEIFYTRKLSGFVQILDFVPEIRTDDGSLRQPSELKVLRFAERWVRDLFLLMFNSNLFYWWLTVQSDCRNLNRRELSEFGVPSLAEASSRRTELESLADRLMRDIQRNSRTLTSNYKKFGTLHIQSTFPKYSKGVIDDAEELLGELYGLTLEEVDFTNNFHYKFRMGLDEDSG